MIDGNPGFKIGGWPIGGTDRGPTPSIGGEGDII